MQKVTMADAGPMLHQQLAASGNEEGNSKGTVMNAKDAVAGNRVPIGLYPFTAIIAGAMAFVEGAVKYGRFNWRIAGVSATVYYNALQRHMGAWFNGEDIDEKSGLHHLWKSAACIAILIDAMVVDKFIDDRPPRAPIGAMLDKLEERVASIVSMHKDKNPTQWNIGHGMSVQQMIDMSGGLLEPTDFIGSTYDRNV